MDGDHPQESRAPNEGRLFQGWSATRPRGWLHVNPLFDSEGSYFYPDRQAEVAVLAIFRVRGILPFTRHVQSDGHWVELFAPTAFECQIHADQREFIVIAPDMSRRVFPLSPGDVSSLSDRIYAALHGPGSFSLVREVHGWALEQQHADLAEYLHAFLGEVTATIYREGEPWFMYPR